tara:strand:- start:384 stop:503 length:120 start_codon:yes stop_codon:yes gene_type:complete
MKIIALAFAVFGFIAFVRVENLIRTLKAKGLLEHDYSEE